MASKKPSKPAVSTQDRLTEVVYIIRGIDAHKQQIVDSANAQLKELEDVKVQYVEKAKTLQAQLEEEQKAKEAPKETKETKEDK
jgi:hypothetical protein